MKFLDKLFKIEGILFIDIILLIIISTVVLRSISPSIFPQYFVYLLLALIFFWFFLSIEFEIFESFSSIFYIFSILFLIIPHIIGQVTRGAIRWIPIGGLTIQPSEIVRPFLIIFFAKYISDSELSLLKIIKSVILLLIPFILILIQPSLGVAFLTFVGFIGVMMASTINKKYFLYLVCVILLSAPLIWMILAPYQKQRIYAFINPSYDPLGAGYNSIQSMISVGSGQFLGRGLGKGIQTQLAFLPEKQTDFIFAAISEELGFLGSIFVILGIFIIFWILILIMERARSPVARAYISGIFLILFVESVIHIGMNMGIVPITGVPLPFISAGGSALLGTTISLSIALKGIK